MAWIEGRIFTARWLGLAGVGLAEVSFVVWGGLFFFTGWLTGPGGKLGSIDFCWMWVSSKFTAVHDPSRIYDQSVLFAAHNIYYHPNECLFYYPFSYPPTYLFFTYMLGLFPYLIAFAVWLGTTLLIYLVAVYMILPNWRTILLALTPFSVTFNISMGHNGFLTAGLFGLSLVCAERRPWLSGIFLGLLSYKPQFGVLFPLALIASRNWRALSSAAATTVILGIAAGFAFGFQSWPQFIAALLNRGSDLSPTPGIRLQLQSIYSIFLMMSGAPWVAWAVHIGSAAIIAAAVWAVWARPFPYPLKAALLCIGSVLVTPFVGPYDLCILSIAVAFVAQDGMARGFLPGERLAIVICWIALYFLLVIDAGAAVSIALFYLVGRRIIAIGHNRLPLVPV